MFPVSTFLAIIPPKAEVPFLADSVVAREGPIHVAAMIGIVALFVVAWILLSEDRPTLPQAKVAKARSAR